MKKILFLTEAYYPTSLPNGVCLEYISKSLLSMGYEIHIISAEKVYGEFLYHNGVNLHYIGKPLSLKLKWKGQANPGTLKGRLCYILGDLLYKILKIVYLPLYPLNSPSTVNRYFRMASELHKKHSFDKIITTYLPIEATYAGIKFKKKFKDIPFGAYILDSMIYISGTQYFSKSIATKIRQRVERNVYSSADMVYNMICHEKHHISNEYDKYRSKMLFLDIPLFSPSNLTVKPQCYNKDKIHLVYMGTLFKNYREPDYLIKLFSMANSSKTMQLHFYTRGSCEEQLASASREYDLVQHGYVSNNLKEQIYYNSHFLINIGVNRTTMISSKIFDYMSYGKPIIHFYYQEDDVNNPYLDNYELCLKIRMDYNLLDENHTKFMEFIENNINKTARSSCLVNLFKLNTPDYTAQIFDNLSISRDEKK